MHMYFENAPHLIYKDVGVLGQAFGWNQFLQQHACGHVD